MVAGSSVPEPDWIEELRVAEGDVFLLRLHCDPAGPRLPVSYGNGLAADMYFCLWGRFLGDFEVVLLDLRNHGYD